MQRAEEATYTEFERLKRELIEPSLCRHEGRLIKTTGDGALVEFASPLAAVRCAAEIQDHLASGGSPFSLRVGINLGDVIVGQDGELYGDGINIAVRLQGIADPGGILISEKVHSEVDGKLDVGFEDRGGQQLKNISRPVRAYAVRAGAHSVLTEGGATGTATRPAPPFSMVVLPFANLIGDPAQNYLADVITDGLTSYLSRMRDAFVIARCTALTYKGKAVDAREVGRELGVRYVLEGSEQHSSGRIRVSAQLIDAETGALLWADRFDADQVDVLQTQDDIVTRLARAVQIELAAVEAARLSRARSAKAGAEELALRGEAIFLRYGPSREQSEAAFDLCQQALEVEPDNVRALSILVERYATRVTGMQTVDREADVRRAEDLAARALAADANSYHARHAKARTLITQKRAEEAMIEAERSLRLNPGYIPTYLDLCQANLMMGLPEKTIEYADRAMRLSPPDPYLYVFYAQEALGHMMLGRDQPAVACLRRAVANNPDFPTPLAYLTAMLALTGADVEARECLKRYLSLPRTMTRTIARWKRMGISDHPAYLALRARINEGLEKAGLPAA
jgi:adenylate cyclase